MEKHIEPRVLLLAAEKIRQHGKRKENAYVLEHISFEQSYDGYTIILKDRDVSISLFFHNKVKADYQKMSDLEAFYQRLVRLSEQE